MTKRIVFDPGHRNTELDYGASGNGLKEAEIALIIANHASDYLKANYTGCELKMTRTSNSQIVDLSKRDDIADNWNADVFVAFHLNAFDKKAKGFETFIYNGEVSAATVALQNTLHAEILTAMRKFGDIVDRGKKRANHSVTRETNCPAILTENLFIDSPSDSRYLKNPAFLKAVGEAHARGVAKFLGLPAKPKSKPEPKPVVAKPSTPSKEAVRRIKVNGKQISALSQTNGILKAVEVAIKDDAETILIERV